ISEDGRLTTVMLETYAFSQPEAGDMMEGFDDLPQGPAVAGPGEKLPPLSDTENSAVVNAVREISARFQAPDFRIHIAGSPVVTDSLKQIMQRDMRRFMLMAIGIIGVFLLLLFRRIAGVLLPILVVLFSVAATIGLLAATGVSFKLPMMILPSFLLAVGVGAVVHLLAVFFRNYADSGDREEAIVYAMGHSGLPIVMTSLTTAAGLLSFATTDFAPVADLGIFASAGIMIALVFTMVLVPALLAAWPLRRTPRFSFKSDGTLVDNILHGLTRFATRHPWPVVLVTLAVSVTAALGLPRLHFAHNTLSWFGENMPLRQSTELIDSRMKGSLSLEVLVDTGRENGLYEPETLRRLEALGAFAGNFRDSSGRAFVGKTNSIADVVKEINMALNSNDPAHYTLPDNRELVAQELLLFENSGSDDLERLVDSQFSTARLTVKVPWNDAAVYIGFLQAVEDEAERLFQGQARVEVTGLLRLFTQTLFLQMRSMSQSYLIAFVVITILMILLIGRFRLGLFSMIPNLLPILITLGMMGWLGIRLDAFTLLIGSIALGLAVDDTIHFFHNYIRYTARTGSSALAIESTMQTTGRALLFTSLVLVAGFWVFMFSEMNHLFSFGLLTGVALALASVFILVVTPAMLTLLARWRVTMVSDEAGQGQGTATGEPGVEATEQSRA
ncbi:MAG: efflux RND transporter permease subunit, partial [Deltaproteobacteria bacterium]|nr:efflux RND transporter permease subunit [Deltaproteobacteria bacterium]